MYPARRWPVFLSGAIAALVATLALVLPAMSAIPVVSPRKASAPRFSWERLRLGMRGLGLRLAAQRH